MKVSETGTNLPESFWAEFALEWAMVEKFREADKAANYVTTGLMHDFPEATVEVIQVFKNRSRRATCATKDVGAILQRMCKRFPMASVEYHPENPYGFVAEIRCHGELGGGTSFRRHTKERPRILVMLMLVNGKEVMVGTHRPPKVDGPAVEN